MLINMIFTIGALGGGLAIVLGSGLSAILLAIGIVSAIYPIANALEKIAQGVREKK